MTDQEVDEYVGDDDLDEALSRVATIITMHDDDPEQVLHSWGIIE